MSDKKNANAKYFTRALYNEDTLITITECSNEH